MRQLVAINNLAKIYFVKKSFPQKTAEKDAQNTPLGLRCAKNGKKTVLAEVVVKVFRQPLLFAFF